MAPAVYTVVVQEKGVNQGLVASRARLAKKGLTIPRLVLVPGHMQAPESVYYSTITFNLK